MRLGEVDGHDYLFVSREKFEEWIAEDQLLEHAMVGLVACPLKASLFVPTAAQTCMGGMIDN